MSNSSNLALTSCTVQDSGAAGHLDRSRDFTPCEQESANCTALQLHLLPKYLIYNILEFMVSVTASNREH